MTEARLLYVTAKDKNEARTIADALLSRGLIACANIFPKMESMYRWEGEVRREGETVMLLKTERRLVDEVTKAVRELHSYEMPCVLTLPIESGSLPYLQWITGELKK